MHRLGAKEAALELGVFREVQFVLNQGQWARSLRMIGEKETVFLDLHLLTAKPVFYVANVDQKELRGEGACLKTITDRAVTEGNKVVAICGDLEAELAQLKEEEREEFRRELGLEGSGLERLVQAGYEALSLVTFYTTVSSELKAWTVSSGTSAPKAAGKIHSDMEKGFIRAEVVSFTDFVACGSEHVARERGLLHSEGKDYLIRDGDIVHFRFNV